jgi:hypothetical protein
MSLLRALPGYIVAMMLAAMGVAMMMMAWVGWSMGVNWYWALGALLTSMMARFNGFVVVGAFFFAHEYLNWDQLQSFGLATMGLMYLTPGVVRDLCLMLTGRDYMGQSDLS